MKTKLMRFCVVVLNILLMVPCGFADETSNQGAAAHMKVRGVVSKVQSGLAHVKTSWGSMTFSLPGSEKLKVSEEVEMQVNENNAVIDVHRKGEPAHSHRYVSGALAYTAGIDEKSNFGHLKERKPLTCRQDDPSWHPWKKGRR